MFTLALSLFIVCNPLGQVPLFLSLMKDFDIPRQRIILARELLASGIIAIFFVFLGEVFLDALQVKTYTVAMCGGIVLFLVALGLIFPKREVGTEGAKALKKEPFIVPIATPLLAGPALLTTVIVLSGQVDHVGILLGAIGLAWIMAGVVLLSAPYLSPILGPSGLTALEQLMGMLLTMLSIRMFLSGLGAYMTQLSALSL